MFPLTNDVLDLSVSQMTVSLNLHTSKCWDNACLILCRFLELHLHSIGLKDRMCGSVMNDTSKALLLYLNEKNWAYESFWWQGVIQRQCTGHLFLKKKKKVLIIQSEVSRLFSSWTYHVDKCPQVYFRKMITEQLMMSRSLERTITLSQVKTI